MKEITTVQQI